MAVVVVAAVVSACKEKEPASKNTEISLFTSFEK
jgi:hypothetical protein